MSAPDRRTTSTSPVGTPVNFHSSQRTVALSTPLVRKFVTPKLFDYIQTSFGLVWAGCHLEHRAYCFNAY